MKYEKMYEESYLIRTFERTVEKKFEEGIMRGTTHGCIGQELIPVLVMEQIDRNNDYITGTHRCHGQVLAYTKDPYRLACEMMGKADGFNNGNGGSQHIKVGRYLTNGVTGGMAAIGMGQALSIKKNGKEGIVVSFLGDGGFQEGYVNETMSMAASFSVPIMYILENNHYAMSTPTVKYSGGTFESRVKALGIDYYYANMNSIDEVIDTIESAFKSIRSNSKPVFVEVDTFRLCGHSKSDSRDYMSDEEKQYQIENDPILQLENKIGTDKAEIIRKQVEAEISEAFDNAIDA